MCHNVSIVFRYKKSIRDDRVFRVPISRQVNDMGPLECGLTLSVSTSVVSVRIGIKRGWVR